MLVKCPIKIILNIFEHVNHIHEYNCLQVDYKPDHYSEWNLKIDNCMKCQT